MFVLENLDLGSRSVMQGNNTLYSVPGGIVRIEFVYNYAVMDGWE